MALVYKGVREDQEPEFAAFVNAASDRLLRFARLLILDHGDAEDAVQDALARLARHWNRVAAPEAYVRRTLVNLARDRGRRRHLIPVPTENRAEGHAVDHSEAIAARQLLDALLRTLPPRQRITVVLRLVEDLSEAETAQLMGCSQGAVKSNLSRGLATLRGQLATLEEVPL